MSPSVTYISPEARRSKILEVLDQHGECHIDQLAKWFEVSGMTIRRDLQELAEEGKVIRTHGGASPAMRVSFEYQFLRRTLDRAAEKEQIARIASSLVQPGNTVMLDSGTTTLAISAKLKQIENLRVITTSLPIAASLFGLSNIELLILGGVLRKDSPDLIGAITDHNLDMLCADIAFVGCDAIDLDGNIYNTSADLGRTLTRVVQAADISYAVADHSKVGKRELMRFGNLAEWGGLITDSGLDEPSRRLLEGAGVQIFQATTATRSANDK